MSEHPGPSGPIILAGVGAVGGTTAGGLLHAGHRVILVDPWYENVEAIRRRGLAVTVDGARHELPAQALYPDELGSLEQRAEVILLACKSYDTVPTVRALEPYLAPDGVVVSLQNGINEDRIAELVGAQRTVGCVVHYNGGMLEPAHAVRFSPSSWHSYTVGELDGTEGERIAAIATLLSAAGGAATTADIYGTLWAKLAVNCMVNALTASSGLSTPAVWGSPIGLELMISLATEAALVAAAQGRPMAPIKLIATATEMPAEMLVAAVEDPRAGEQIRTLMGNEGAKRMAASAGGPEMATSMLQDMRKRRRPEIDYLNGYVVQEGARLAVATPANAAAVALLRAVATGEERQEATHLDRLAESLKV